MSDYEEEHFPVGIRTSFSSTFDTDWHQAAAGVDFAPIRRSFSEFYRGERITVDAVHNSIDEFQNVSSDDEIQNSVDDSDLDTGNLTGSNQMKLGSDSSCVPTTDSLSSNKRCQSYQSGCSIPDNYSKSSDHMNGYNERGTTVECSKIVSHPENDEDSAKNSDLSPGARLHDAFTRSQHGSVAVNDIVRQRIVSEIRNNIPDVGSVKSCTDSSYEHRQSSPDTVLHGEFARFRKRSPGVAKRLEATTPSRGESCDMSVLSSAAACEANEAAVSRCYVESDSISTLPSIVASGSTAASSVANMTVSAVHLEGLSSQKESSKHLSLADTRQMSGTWDSLSDDLAYRTDPFRYSGMMPDAVLFVSCDDAVADQTIRLSPEMTECDSDNVSTLEDNSIDDVVDGCLPVVEDGLSCSDTDEMSASGHHSSQPSNLTLTVDSSHTLSVSETEVTEFFSGSCDMTSVKDTDAVERAIRDIRLAMERSKGFAVGSPKKSQTSKLQSSLHDVENVWVSRAE